MKTIKEFLLKNKTVTLLVSTVIVFVIVSVTVIVSQNFSGNNPKQTYGEQEQSASDAVKEKKTEEERTSDDQETTALTDVSAEVETDADGSISSVVTEDGQKIDLSDENIQKETDAAGTTTYTMADGSQVVIRSDGSTKVIKHETVTNVTEAASPSQSKPADSQNQSSTQHTSGTSQPESSPTAEVPQAPVETPTETTTQPPTQAPVPPTECPHSSLTKRVVVPATSTSDGSWESVCSSCGAVLETGSIHSHSAYQVDIGGGQTATVYGYYEEEVAAEIFRQLNQYRQENGLAPLENRFHSESNIRAVECAYSYSHTRPNGQNDWDLNSMICGENINVIDNYVGSVESRATGFMVGWKNSPGHNATMLDEYPILGGVGVFTSIIFDEQGIPVSTETYAVQNFGHPDW